MDPQSEHIETWGAGQKLDIYHAAGRYNGSICHYLIGTDISLGLFAAGAEILGRRNHPTETQHRTARPRQDNRQFRPFNSPRGNSTV